MGDQTMRVVAERDFSVVRECQVLRFREGEVIEGDVARYLLTSGAAVTEQPAVKEGEQTAAAAPSASSTVKKGRTSVPKAASAS